MFITVGGGGVGWGELCRRRCIRARLFVWQKSTKVQICPKTFVRDCRYSVKRINGEHVNEGITDIE